MDPDPYLLVSSEVWIRGSGSRSAQKCHLSPTLMLIQMTVTICLSYFFISSNSYSHYLYRPHHCTTCQEDFASSEDLVQHLAARHDGAGIAASCDDVYRDSQLDKPFQCCNPGCGLYFKTLTGKSHCLTLSFHGVAPKFV